MSKFDLSAFKAKLNEEGIETKLKPMSQDAADYVVMPEWWGEAFGVMGLPHGHIVQIAGDSDTGKTSGAMEAMRRAQEQGHLVVYIETEGKTTDKTLESWGVEPEGVVVISESFTEVAFDSAFHTLDQLRIDFPGVPILFVLDSYGNTVSVTEEDNSMQKEARVGGTAKVNRRGINILKAKMRKLENIACLFINYNYDNIGSPGKTEAGGKGLKFFSSLIIQTSRISWVEAQVAGKKVRKGAAVKWTAVKNHLALPEETRLLPKFIELTITAEGFKLKGEKKKAEEEPKPIRGRRKAK